MVLKQDVSKAENCLVVHLFEAAMNLVPYGMCVFCWCCFNGDVCTERERERDREKEREGN